MDVLMETQSKMPIGKSRKRCEVPIWHKANLTLEEAATYSGIGINK